MAKYFITFIILAFLALENNNIYNRLHAKSYPSGSINAVTHFMRQHQYRHHTQTTHNKHYPTHDQHQTHHARKHVQQHQKQNFDNSQEEDDLPNDSRRQMQRIKRHMQQQMQHRLEHEKRLQQRSQRPVYNENALKTMPRIWQHLSMVDDYDYADDNDRMYGDGPAADSAMEIEDVNENILNLEIPAYVDVDEGFIDHVPAEEEPFENNIDDNNSKTIETGCPKCVSNRKVEHVSEEELTGLRIEFVKQQILEKLRLKERPNVSAVGLPKPIYDGVTIEQDEDSTVNKDLDDYYARTSKKFIFLEVEKHECRKLGPQPSMCFSFKIDDADADGYDVSTAVLWLFKNNSQNIIKRNDTLLLSQQTIVVSEVQQQLDSNYLPLVKTIAIQSVDVQDEWMKIDIEWPIKRWFGNHDLSHLIQITCQSCDIESMEYMISTDKDYRPFIMVDTQNRKRQPRQKREINCTDGVTECCREKLYISFEEIGWGDWIISPRGYDAYFCRGTCGMVASITNSGSHHNVFLQKMLNKPGKRKNLELVPCCTAKQYSSLQLVFMDSNSTATQKTFPNMVVESCGCR